MASKNSYDRPGGSSSIVQKEKAAARKEREKRAQAQVDSNRGPPLAPRGPLFGPPIQVKSKDNSDISSVLGSYDVAQEFIMNPGSSSTLGVSDQPMTPGAFPKKKVFPTADSSRTPQTTPVTSKERTQDPRSQPKPGALQNQPLHRQGLFDSLAVSKVDSPKKQGERSSSGHRIASGSGRESANGASSSDTHRLSGGSGKDGKSSNQNHQPTKSHPPQASDSSRKSASGRVTPSGDHHTPVTDRSSSQRSNTPDSRTSHNSSSRSSRLPNSNSAPASANSRRSEHSHHDTPKSSKSASERKPDQRNRSVSPSIDKAAVQKRLFESSSSVPPPPGGTKEKTERESHRDLKLVIPANPAKDTKNLPLRPTKPHQQQHHGGRAGFEDSFDVILQEFTVQPPLTAINTPKKEDSSKFPFPAAAAAAASATNATISKVRKEINNTSRSSSSSQHTSSSSRSQPVGLDTTPQLPEKSAAQLTVDGSKTVGHQSQPSSSSSSSQIEDISTRVTLSTTSHASTTTNSEHPEDSVRRGGSSQSQVLQSSSSSRARVESLEDDLDLSCDSESGEEDQPPTFDVRSEVNKTNCPPSSSAPPTKLSAAPTKPISTKPTIINKSSEMMKGITSSDTSDSSSSDSSSDDDAEEEEDEPDGYLSDDHHANIISPAANSSVGDVNRSKSADTSMEDGTANGGETEEKTQWSLEFYLQKQQAMMPKAESASLSSRTAGPANPLPVPSDSAAADSTLTESKSDHELDKICNDIIGSQFGAMSPLDDVPGMEIDSSLFDLGSVILRDEGEQRIKKSQSVASSVASAASLGFTPTQPLDKSSRGKTPTRPSIEKTSRAKTPTRQQPEKVSRNFSQPPDKSSRGSSSRQENSSPALPSIPPQLEKSRSRVSEVAEASSHGGLSPDAVSSAMSMLSASSSSASQSKKAGSKKKAPSSPAQASSRSKTSPANAKVPPTTNPLPLSHPPPPTQPKRGRPRKYPEKPPVEKAATKKRNSTPSRSPRTPPRAGGKRGGKAHAPKSRAIIDSPSSSSSSSSSSSGSSSSSSDSSSEDETPRVAFKDSPTMHKKPSNTKTSTTAKSPLGLEMPPSKKSKVLVDDDRTKGLRVGVGGATPMLDQARSGSSCSLELNDVLSNVSAPGQLLSPIPSRDKVRMSVKTAGVSEHLPKPSALSLSATSVESSQKPTAPSKSLSNEASSLVHAGLQYINGKPSIMVRISLDKLGKYASRFSVKPESKQAATETWRPSSPLVQQSDSSDMVRDEKAADSESCHKTTAKVAENSVLPSYKDGTNGPLAVEDVEVFSADIEPVLPSSQMTPQVELIEEEEEEMSGSESSGSGAISDESEDEADEKVPTPASLAPLSPDPSLPQPDKASVKAAKDREEQKEIYMQLMGDQKAADTAKPLKAVKIPKRKSEIVSGEGAKADCKRRRQDYGLLGDDEDIHSHGASRQTQMAASVKELFNHEDDHKWDRKHQWRAGEDDRWSVTSASSQHSDDVSRHRSREPREGQHSSHSRDGVSHHSRHSRSHDRHGRHHSRDSHSRESHSHDSHSRDSHSRDSRSQEHHSRDQRSRDSHSRDSHSRDSHSRVRDTHHSKLRDWDAPINETPANANVTPTYSSSSHGSSSVAKDWGAMAIEPYQVADRRGDEMPLDRRRERGRESRRVAPAVDEKLKSAEHYHEEARRCKHQGDKITDRFSKSLMYVESVLSFLQFGTAMEHEHKETSKISKVYNDTLNLSRFICNNKSGSHKEKKLIVLCLRLQSFLCQKLFKAKKAEAAKLKRIIDDHTKGGGNKSVVQAPSPYQASSGSGGGGHTWLRTTGTPSPMSPQPSPAGSVASITSVGSVNGDMCTAAAPKLLGGGGGAASSSPAAAATTSGCISVPTRIHSITQQYLQHTNFLFQCHDLWDQADTAILDHKDFFRDLDSDCGKLTMQSSVPELVRYVKVGLHRLKEISAT